MDLTGDEAEKAGEADNFEEDEEDSDADEDEIWKVGATLIFFSTAHIIRSLGHESKYAQGRRRR
jgi:hypothetical protein